MLWLKNFNNIPPGEYYYSQNGASFGPSPEIQKIVGDIAAFRASNKLPGASINEAFNDIVNFTVSRLVARLGTNNEWLIDTESPGNPMIVASSGGSGGGCAGCGAKL